ncbi:Cna B-type domain-containing protein [Blautia glucerasea]|uniref:Cna B-type domain-containing protein n=2 Tax=Clostridia TaxID=186801 RepID=UPI001D018905|nr:Cna B-type domain-containing protein [Blautia glucerasea]MCB5382301.1 Cna B-type domain-containing protein [Blautia glucerasea]
MKKNGYLRRFLALFLALVMIMADSSVTTFAATVGRVKQKSAAAESSSQCNVQINVAEELDVEQFLNDYKYIMLGTETPDKWPGIGATSSIEKISTTENVVLNDVAEGTEKKIYFVQGKESWQWGAYKTTGDTFQQGENKFKISVSETASGLTVNINKVEFISRNVQIVADADLDFAAFTNQYKYVMLGKTTSSGVEAVSTIEQIDSNTTDVELKVDKDENADDLKLYFIRDTYNLNSNLTNDSKFKQGNVNYKIAVTTDNNNFNVNIEKVVFQPGPTVDYKSVLGNSLHFGIVANDFTCNGDLEANLAVGTLHGSGNMKSSKNYGGNGTTLIGAYVDYGWYIFKNSEGGQGDLILYTTPDAANRFGNDIWSKGLVIDTETYSQEEIQNIVRSMVDESRMTSNKLASDAHTKGLKYSSVADENGVIDLTTSPAGTYYIDFEIGEYANSNLNLKITGDQNIVLNIPDETATLKTYQLNIDGKNCNIGGYANGGIGEKACENIIFNLNNASSVISETIHGVVLVPNGSFENKAVGAGWIVADSVTSGGTEWHCLSRDIPVVTSYAIKAKKTVNGKAPSGNEAGKFTFKLYKIDDKGNETLVDTKSNGDGGLVSFDTFGNITEAGTYWYKITEEGTVAGYTIDTTVYYAEVVVNATPSNGVIISKNAKVTYHKGTKTGDTATVATFNNIKKEDETSANIKVKKTFTNGAADKKFNFVLTPINNAPMPEGAVNGKKTISVAQNDGVKNFGEIKYTTAGTYRYEVVEDSSEQAAGITYDNHRWTVTVAVPADFSTPTVTYSREDGITSTIGAEFTNSEENKETEITLEGTKSLSGRNLKAGEFKFEVKDEVGTVVATGTNDAAGKIAFSRIGYKLSDLKKGDGSYASEKTYSYKVSEVKGNAGDGITYDDKEYTVKVKVSYDQASGTMKAELADKDQKLAFANSYDTETGIDLEGTKSLEGRTLKDGEFTFEVKGKAGKVVATGSNKSDGSISFNNKLNYKLSDLEKADGSYESEKTYEYTVNEVIPEGATAENNYTVNGVTYDNSIFTVKVIVSYDQATGIMSAAFAEDSQELIFDNTYDAKGSLTLEASKTLKNKALEADAFNFVLKDKNGETIQTVANDADGNVTFSPLNYTLKDVGTHVYTVSEVQRENTEVTYDTTEYTVEVTVADAGNGKLKVSKTIKKGDYTVDAIAFENIYKGVIDISGSKTWNDADNQDGIRPASITVKLFANGTEAASQVVTPDEAGNWNYVFKNLPQYDAKGKITYTVTESAVAGYETSVSGYNITNTHKPATLDITGTKTWNDSNNQDGKRPKSITVNLLANGIITDTKTVTADDNWTYSFTDLPKYANGQEITYTVSELTVPGYTTTIDDNYNITNSYTPGETSASVTKIWDDADNQDGIRPESITVALLANGTPTNKTVTLTAANNWTQTITGLPEKADGEYITYTWTEVNVPEGYSLTGTSKNEKVTTLTNTHTPELTSITGTKTWKDADNQDGKRPESITVNLFADGTKLKSQSVSADADGNWSYSFTDLPKYANGQEITYTVTEDAVDGYTTESDGYNFINTHQPETTEITGTKTWNDANNQDGKRPESITVILLANGTEKTRQAVTADEAGNWTYTFKDLPKYANGQEITYTVAEEEVTDYTTTYDGSNITNSYTPGKTSATVTKIWNDAENQDGKRPESITVSLLADGKETGKTVTLSVENNWKQTISDLSEKADGKAIEYTWTEETLPEGYELTDNSKNGTVTTLTNTYAPETTSITVTKTWDDADNQDGKRPESIIVNLLANGEIVASQTVKADEAGNWTYTFKDLPKYANGKEITYTVTEEAVEGYETSVDGFNITNTYTTETTEVKGSKTWNDADNQDGKRPESITVRLLANGEEKDSQTVTADENGNWTYSFEKLPKYEAGKEILYTVTEDAVADYTTEITGYDITNSYAPGKTSVTVTKAWADNDDRGGHRPKEIKVQLKADGENSGEEITLNAENNWTYTWSDLDQKKAGKDIAYTVEETGKAVGYISTVTGNAEEGFIITNTITSVKISKVDITDQKELAGAHIQVIDKDGNVVEEWDSTWEAHEVTGLKPGETYTLRETVAPEGYTLTSDTTFTLKEDGTVNKDTTTTTISDNGTLLVEDSRTSVKVSKVDISDGKELEGAHIQIIDQDGNVVDEWDSTKEAHVTEKLKTGKIYTLRETVAPDGYLLTSDTTFVLKEDGTVDAEKTTAVSKDGVLLVQDKLATSASIAVTKKLTYIGENLAARDQTFYVALYSDKECTQRVSDVKALVFKNADASTVVFSENIKAGKTYYIAECTQDGTSQTIGALADGTVYEAVFGNGNSTTVTEANGTTTVSFENVFSSFPPDGFYKQGQLTITKKVLGADGGTRNSNEVFYAGIFDDAAHTQLSQQVEQNIIKLDMDGGYEVSEIINVGLAQSGAKVTLYVTETDSNGKPIAGSEGFGYKVTVSADSVIFDETNMTAEVVITNQEESTVTETPTPTPSSDGGNSGGSENHSGGYGGSKSPKTGDDTPIGTYLMLLLAAAMLAAETERRRRRNKRQ